MPRAAGRAGPRGSGARGGPKRAGSGARSIVLDGVRSPPGIRLAHVVVGEPAATSPEPAFVPRQRP